MSAACLAISESLKRLGINYAIAGGFACTLYNSDRLTVDIDIVVSCPGSEVRTLKVKIAEGDERFHSVGNGLYFGPKRIPIELLPTDVFRWPVPLSAGSHVVMISADRGLLAGHDDANGKEVQGQIIVLTPAAILFSKTLRTVQGLQSSRPKSRIKLYCDLRDMIFVESLTDVTELQRTLSAYPIEKANRILSDLHLVVEADMEDIQDLPGFDNFRSMIRLLPKTLLENE